MNRIWTKAIIVTAIAVMGTHAISFTVRYILGAPADNVTLLMATVIPAMIAMPITLFIFLQTERLDRAHAALVVANEALARKASRDQMTGLLNRESFLSQVEVTRNLPGGGTLLIIDADHFKRINDRHGHPTGDEALVRIAAAIAGSVRQGDIVGWIGGEEFAAFLAGADRGEATRIGQRLRAAVENAEFLVDGGECVPLTVSVGGAVSKREPVLGELMRQADGCLYEAKRAGRNRVIIESGLTIAA